MENQRTHDIIIIDDDKLNNMICKTHIQLEFPKADILTFAVPREGIDYILSKYNKPNLNKTILLLDINMPQLSGWDVLDIFMNFPDMIKQQFEIYMFSSSIAIEDKERAQNNHLVSGFIEKPLSVFHLQTMFPGTQLQT